MSIFCSRTRRSEVNRVLLNIMEVLPCEDETKLTKRIKLEHSYASTVGQFEFAEVREEDPLKIFPEDLDSIKTETEDVETILIKTEPDNCDGDNDNSQSLNLQSTNQCNEHSGDHQSDCVEPMNSCEVEIGNNTNVLPYNDAVPRHVFLELQKMYEKTMSDLKVLGEDIYTGRNTKRKRGSRAQNSGDSHTKLQALKNEIKKLKEELYSVKAKEQTLKAALDIRMQKEMELKKSSTKLEKQLGEFEKTKKDHGVYINELKHQLVMKDSTIRNLQVMARQQLKVFNKKKKENENDLTELKLKLRAKESLNKECEVKCSFLTQKLSTMNVKFFSQKTELAKLRLDMDVMDKSIIDSLKTRQTLKEHLVQLQKEYQEMKSNPAVTVKLQEAHKSLHDANRRIDELQKLLASEKKVTTFMSKAKDQLKEELDRKFKETNNQLTPMKQSIAILKTSLCQKIEQCKVFKEEIINLHDQIKSKEEEIKAKENEIRKKEQEYETKQCQYCGF